MTDEAIYEMMAVELHRRRTSYPTPAITSLQLSLLVNELRCGSAQFELGATHHIMSKNSFAYCGHDNVREAVDDLYWLIKLCGL